MHALELATKAHKAFPHAQDMLTVKMVLPESPADNKLCAASIVLVVDRHTCGLCRIESYGRCTSGLDCAHPSVATHWLALLALLEPANCTWGSFVVMEFTALFLVDGMRSTCFCKPELVVDSTHAVLLCAIMT
ncbi:hypothetical protein FB645_004211 [Coemansia sp. IMI 203386]|nr:hypothetical protein FB645_004211 [Coemansia sp. IMI 203386]